MRLVDITKEMKLKVMKKINGYDNPPDDYIEDKNEYLPDTLNLMVTDVCNSHCVMCNIWERKQEKEFTPSELEKMLRDPLFARLKHIGVSGGEPTLRKDLSEIFRVITRKAGIRGVSLITNALKADTVISQVKRCNAVCKERYVPFSLMVSLDGVGKIHDMVRGRAGSFENALKVIRYIRDKTDIPLSVACTVVKENVLHLDEVLDFCREEKVYGRFRIAEFINRLYNAKLTETIRNFDNDERYQIALFFSKLELTYENNPSIKATYRNIRRMVFDERERESGCPYRSAAVGLNSKGNLIFCSPKSPFLGSCLEESALKLHNENLAVRENIIKEYCGNCIHDYHAQPVRELLEEAKEEAHFKNVFSVKEVLKDSKKTRSPVPQELDWSGLIAPLIIGWYGTETAGDKAILGNIIKKINGANKSPRITVASLYPFVTKRTLYELDTKVAVVKTFSKEYLEACKNADAIIMGGGPLMGMEPLGFVLKAFLTAQRRNIQTIVEGCGIGPLSEEIYISVVKEILRLSSSIKVRDRAGLDWVIEKTGRKDAIRSGDPAVEFVEQWKKENPLVPAASKGKHFTCFLREITTEYANGMKQDDFLILKKKFEDELGKMVLHIIKKTGLTPLFMPMHTFVIGNDDRDFNRRFAKTHVKGGDYELGENIYSPKDILSAMSRSRFNLCMRFHSVLFADTLGVPYVAIDYTGGGKIKGYLKDRQREALQIDRYDLAEGQWRETTNNALINVISDGNY